MTGPEGRPPWWTPRLGEREVLLSLAAMKGASEDELIELVAPTIQRYFVS